MQVLLLPRPGASPCLKVASLWRVLALLSSILRSNDTSVEIWVDSVSLQPFTKEEWRTHQDQSVEKVKAILGYYF